MGKQKQQRRSAKKKGKAGAGQNKCEGDESVKCTACAQLVKPEDTIACPIPECDRVFCTKKCSSSCLVQCADPLCLLPNRCRPCASGKTLALLEKRNKASMHGLPIMITDNHHGYFPCDACPNKICDRCNYFNNCSKCHKRVCLGCVDSDSCILNFCGGACNAVYCDQCDEGFDVLAKKCTGCIVEAQFLAEEGEWPKYDADQAKMWSDESKIVNEVVLQYAEEIKLVMSGIALFSSAAMDKDYLRLGSISTDGEGCGVGALSRGTMKLVARIVRPSREVSETTPQRVKGIFRTFSDKAEQLRREIEEISVPIEGSGRLYQLSSERANLFHGIASALAPDVAVMLGAFHCMEGQTSGDGPLLTLQGIQLDIMHDLYQKELCGHCLRHAPDGDSTKRCGGCSAIRYCNGTCQALSWPVHRHHCRRMSVVRREYNDNAKDGSDSKEADGDIVQENDRPNSRAFQMSSRAAAAQCNIVRVLAENGAVVVDPMSLILSSLAETRPLLDTQCSRSAVVQFLHDDSEDYAPPPSDDEEDEVHQGSDKDMDLDEADYASDESSIYIEEAFINDEDNEEESDNVDDKLSEGASGELAWRLDQTEMSIEGRRGGGEKEYHIHLERLALGTRKCGYFTAQFKHEFIEAEMRKDMAMLEAHLSEFGSDGSEEARAILGAGCAICAEKINKIPTDSTLLFGMSPAFFLQMFTLLRAKGSLKESLGTVQAHSCKLVVAYIRKHKHSLDEAYFSALTRLLLLPDDYDAAGPIALDLLEIIEEKGWTNIIMLESFEVVVSRYLGRTDVSEVISKIPELVVSRYLGRTDVSEVISKIPIEATAKVRGDASTGKKNESVTGVDVDITFIFQTEAIHGVKRGDGILLTLNSKDTIQSVKYFLCRSLDRPELLGKFEIRKQGEGKQSRLAMEKLCVHKTLSDYGIAAGATSLCVWYVSWDKEY